MGIVNVTPDSFSDGGQFLAPERAVAHAKQLVEEGADIIDVGGESTRPGAVPVPEAEELRRVLPVLEELAGQIKVPISIDTMKPGVARAALKGGASIVNDVGADRTDCEMWRLVADTGAGYICVHMQGTPQNMQIAPSYKDVVAEVTDYFLNLVTKLNDCGVAHEQLIIDPGIGFGKTAEHNLRLLAGIGSFAHLERPLLLGMSRKSFLGARPGGKAGRRVTEGLACACLAVEAGVQMIRTHDVAETVAAVRMTESILAKRRV